MAKTLDELFDYLDNLEDRVALPRLVSVARSSGDSASMSARGIVNSSQGDAVV